MTNEAQRRTDDGITRPISSLYFRLQRNAWSSISRLPTEILAEIFVHVARDHYDRYLPGTRVSEWVGISYVCRQWRNTALDCPTLWSYLFFASQRWTEALLARSKQTPLKVSLEINYSEEEWLHSLMERVVDHAERIQELRLYLRGDVYWCLNPFLRPCLRAPRLQVLEIRARLPYILEKSLFNGETPSLRKLDLTNVTMSNLHSFRLSDLKSLTMKDAFYSGPTMVEFLSTLCCLRDIEDLHIHNALPSANRFLASADFDAFRGINLPHLSRLWIYAPLSTVVGFLSCVNTPPKTEMRLGCGNESDTSPDDYSRFSSLLSQRFRSSKGQTPSVPTIRTLGVDLRLGMFVFSASDRGCGCLFDEDEDEGEMSCARNIPLRLRIQFGTMMPQMFSISSDICRNVCPRDVHWVHIRGLVSSSNFWESALGHFQNLRYLKVTASKTLDLVSALSRVTPMESQDGYVGQGSRLLCVPNLEVLELGQISRRMRRSEGEVIDNFRPALSIRKGQGRPLKRLVINVRANHRAFDPKDVLDLPVDEVWMNGKKLLER
ncbi:hypothetical protein HD554DRAFT_452021 [Boletus coccyginus]|nr:hypothetical protein HD554DRAFT_452021 [Boletus coccyginus]